MFTRMHLHTYKKAMQGKYEKNSIFEVTNLFSLRRYHFFYSMIDSSKEREDDMN